ncbi:tyrosine protein phosphatase PTP3 Ecym_3500 [Eremothecium cymbalariae DBVPG|uniref:protein-tyrosine-phosphatase n=1 Tax=Eremothecium cymbalariae (strain CBS 270.75 / DBVPG 7215 / KCTC 17166 / NRRL Y-17582) TaxID=931890 RepID=G8JS61_ERECY|nr:Hypothetical protein Ecym_3500 [Eremothecium cymbalariae DBVPG\
MLKDNCCVRSDLSVKHNHKPSLSDSMSILSNASTLVDDLQGGNNAPTSQSHSVVAACRHRSRSLEDPLHTPLSGCPSGCLGSAGSPYGINSGAATLSLSGFKPTCTNGNNTRFQLHSGCKTIDCKPLANMLLDHDETYGAAKNIIVIDTRPYMEYSKAHIKDSIHISLPSTLLKRKNFSLQRLLDNLPAYERNLIKEKLKEEYSENDKDSFSVVIYDNTDVKPDGRVSLACFGISSKFLDNDWPNQGQRKPDVYILSGGFPQFQSQFPDLAESSPMEYDRELLQPPAVYYSSTSSLSTPPSTQGSPLVPVCSPTFSSPISHLFKFQLPHAPRQNLAGSSQSFQHVFKMRQFEENSNLESYLDAVDLNENRKLSSSEYFTNPSTPQQQYYKFPLKLSFQLEFDAITETYDAEQINAVMPRWFRNLMDKSSKMQFIEKFQRLDIIERTRLDRLLKMPPLSSEQITEQKPGHKTSSLDGGYSEEDDEYDRQISISSGVELGSKNRYKDIFPYEHTRVILRRDLEITKLSQEPHYNGVVDTYINANYLTGPFTTGDSPSNNTVRYIATQAPLSETIHDFYTCIINNRVPIVITLTDEFENGLEKCCKFWAEGDYNGIQVALLQERKENNLYLRRIKLTFNSGKSTFQIFQIQIKDWPDLGVLVNPTDILSMLDIKNFIISELFKRGVFNKGDLPTVLVHCSAGCGRTGTFCTVDTIVSNLKNIDAHEIQWEANHHDNNNLFDPIVITIDRFRKQRISMVQNINQFLFIYDCMLSYFKLHLNNNTCGGDNVGLGSFTNSMGELDILEDFLCSKKNEL